MDKIEKSKSLIFKFVYGCYLKKKYLVIIELAKTVYTELSWGWNESVYREALYQELTIFGYVCGQELTKPIYYKGNQLSNVNVRLDLMVKKDNLELIIELKADSASKNTMIKAEQQCRRYLKTTGLSNGMVINFPEKPDGKIEFIFIINNETIKLNNQIVKNNKTKTKFIPKINKTSAVKCFLYNKENRDHTKTNHPEIKATEITGYLSRQWKSMSDVDKLSWSIKDNINN